MRISIRLEFRGSTFLAIVTPSIENFGKNVLAGTHKKFYRIQHAEIYLLDLKVQYKHKMKLPLGMVSKHIFLYLCLPNYYLINAIRNLLQSKCPITATTGKVAYHIRGITVHCLLKLPVGSRGKKDLTGQSLCRLQEHLTNIDYIILDEYSMLGQVSFGWIDKHCKQATGYNDKVFGGKSLILTGDPGQLPPVGDKPLYYAKPSRAFGEQGLQAYQLFDKVVKLTVNQQVQGMTSEQVSFRELLLRLRKGESTIDDWKLLLTCQPSNVTNIQQFNDATRLFYSNEQVANYNHEQLTKLEHPIAHINAHHSSEMAKKIPSDDMSGLEPIVFLAKDARVMLTMNLWSTVGLCNGATGKVRQPGVNKVYLCFVKLGEDHF